MKSLAPAFEKIFVSCILNQRMLETIVALGQHAFDEHDVGVGELFQRRFQWCIFHGGDGLQEIE